MSEALDWAGCTAAIWYGSERRFRVVRRLDPVELDDLLGIEPQKDALCENTRRFLEGLPCHHALLWGSRGCGKSSLVKAVLNRYADQGLRLVEVAREDLIQLPVIVDQLVDLPYRFVLYCDDLSFEQGEVQYKALKRVIEGSIELPPDNIRVYATSNRRHLLPEYVQDNAASRLVGEELHHGDQVEEQLSLADRFGLWLSFYPLSHEDYLQLIDHLFAHHEGLDPSALHTAARRFAIERGGRSGRTARQFFHSWSAG